jgi:hypothetical protein
MNELSDTLVSFTPYTGNVSCVPIKMEVAILMSFNQKNTPINPDGKDDQASTLKSFVESSQAGETIRKQHEKATGANNYMDEQNKMIDTRNLRK